MSFLSIWGLQYHNPKNLWFIIKLRGYIPSCLCPLHAALAAAALSVHHAHGLTLEDRLGVYIGFAFKNLGLNLNQPIYGYIWSIAFVHEWGHQNLWPSKCGKWWSIGWKKPIWCINWFFKSFLWSRCRLITSCASGFLASQPSGDRVVWGQPIWKLLQQKSPTMKLQGPCRSLKSIQNSSHFHKSHFAQWLNDAQWHNDLLCYPQSSCEMPQLVATVANRGRDAAHWTKRSHLPGVCPAYKIPGKLGVWCWKHLQTLVSHEFLLKPLKLFLLPKLWVTIWLWVKVWDASNSNMGQLRVPRGNGTSHRTGCGPCCSTNPSSFPTLGKMKQRS